MTKVRAEIHAKVQEALQLFADAPNGMMHTKVSSRFQEMVGKKPQDVYPDLVEVVKLAQSGLCSSVALDAIHQFYNLFVHTYVTVGKGS